MFKSLDLNSGITYATDLPVDKNFYAKYEQLLDVSLTNAAKGRKEEFVAARACAIKAFKEFGLEVSNIKKDESRKPIWPKGFMGSLSHTKNIAMASIYKEGYCQSVGIDCEIMIKDDKFEKIKSYITRKEDIDFFHTIASNKLMLAHTLMFSAKESLYKAINPLCNEFFGFQEAYLSGINFEDETFEIVLNTDIENVKPFETVYFGRFIATKSYIITSIEVL